MIEIPDKVEIAAIVSSDPEKRKSFQAEFSVPKAYETLLGGRMGRKGQDALFGRRHL